MEERKNSNIGLAVLITVLVMLVLGLSGFIVYDKVIKQESNSNNTSNIVENNEQTDIIEDRNAYNTDDIYRKYLETLKNKVGNLEKNKLAVSGTTLLKDISFRFNIDSTFKLSFQSDKENYKVSDSVLDMFLVEEGNGGYQYLYFITDDGKVHDVCVDCILFENDKTIHNYALKNIVKVSTIELTGAFSPIFTDIDGNLIEKDS